MFRAPLLEEPPRAVERYRDDPSVLALPLWKRMDVLLCGRMREYGYAEVLKDTGKRRDGALLERAGQAHGPRHLRRRGVGVVLHQDARPSLVVLHPQFVVVGGGGLHLQVAVEAAAEEVVYRCEDALADGVDISGANLHAGNGPNLVFVRVVWTFVVNHRGWSIAEGR